MTRHSGLGRGLGALIPSAIASLPSGEREYEGQENSLYREVAIDSIRPNAFQPRKQIDSKELQPLADSIKELGILQPLLVRPVELGNRATRDSELGDRATSYELIAGERRWRAARLAGLPTVPVLVREVQDLASLEQALVENLHRKDLNPLDEAAAYRQLIDDFHMTHDDVGRRVGKSRTTISNLLRLLQLAPKIQKRVMEGHLSEGHARALLGTSDESFQSQLAERIVREGLTVRATEEIVRLRNELQSQSTDSRTRRKAAIPSAAVLEWQEQLMERLDTRVTITQSGRRGKIVVEFANSEDLDRLGSLLTPAVDLNA